MKIELHILQNFSPSNLNRDDTGAPKDCELGGYRRARISSQCQKRAVRETFRLDGLLADDELGARTKRLVHEVAEVLVSKFGHEEDAARALVLGALEGAGLKAGTDKDEDKRWKTEYLLFVPRRIVGALAELLHEHRAELAPAVQAGEQDEKAKKASKKEQKSAAKSAYPKEVQNKVVELLQSARGTADLALFGRMIADKPGWNVEAACQVAHAISTNRVQMDFDFFTAVDDFKSADTAGSDMMGTVQFNSSCFYRYSVLDVAALNENLDLPGADKRLLERTVSGFVQAFVSAIPTGKQNSMAAHNFPSYVLAVVREHGQPLSMANAFLKPAKPVETQDADLVDDSVAKLERYFSRIRDGVGVAPALAATWADRDIAAGGVERVPTLGALVEKVTATALGALR